MKKVAETHGGEYAGPCPFCGGNDRFRVWPEDRGGRYWCRGCGKNGDVIQYLRDHDGLSYLEACEKLDIKVAKKRSTRRRRSANLYFKPREVTMPQLPARWTERLGEFLETAKHNLWSIGGMKALEFLHSSKGLTDETIQAAALGWNPADRYHDREAWGLPVEIKADGKQRRLWTPEGIVIPCFDKGRLIRIRIRRSDPGDGPRYILIPGSITRPLRFNLNKNIVVIVESELDGLLVHQEAGILVDVIALGAATIRPDQEMHDALKNAERILIALDSDGPGARESWHFWRNTYGGKGKRWPVPIGKDPSEAWQQGLDIRAWIEAGLD